VKPRRPLVVRGVIVVAGFALLALGALLLVLPGPGLVVIAAGLGLLAMEFRWAAGLRDAVLRRTERIRPRKRSSQIAGTVVLLAAGAAVTVASVVWGLPV
jgi:uncharacterized protein (TIGR02611 family)